MAFLIPDNIRNRQDVPASIRRVATALKLGLDDDAIVWFEPLFDATGEKPHFIVFMPENGVAVLEVLDVKSSKLLGPLRGKLRIERDGVEIEVDQPLARAQAFADVLEGRIAAEPRLARHRLPVVSAACFPSLDRNDAEEKGLAGVGGFDGNRTFFRSEIDDAVGGAVGAELHRRFARILGLADPVEDSLVDVVRGLIQPHIVIDSTEGDEQLAIFRAPEGAEIVRVMDRRQEALAKSMGDGHRVVRGVAGSGKTLVLVYRARLFAELHPQRQFLLTCYTRALASELRVLLGDVENVEVVNLDRLIGMAINEAGLPDPGYTQDPSGEARAAVGLEALQRGALVRYRAVFVDEAQDFGTKALRFAVTLADEKYGDVLVVADAAQDVFRRKGSWKEAGIQAQGRSRILTQNYRNTREILELAYSFLVAGSDGDEAARLEDENVIVVPEAALRSGPIPSVTLCDSAELVKLAVEEAKLLVDDGTGPKQLAMLCMGNRQAIELERRLRAEGMEFFFVTDPQSKQNPDHVAEAQEAIILSTVYSAKGMEFPNVVLCCTPRDRQELDSLRSAIYVGMTRATERLLVFAENDHPLAGDIEGAARGRGRLSIATTPS